MEVKLEGGAAKKVELCEIAFDPLTLREAAMAVSRCAERGSRLLVVPINVDVLMLAQSDPELKRICIGADMVLADGMPIVWLSKLAGRVLPERVTGADMLPEVCRMAARDGRSVFFVGGLPGAIEEVARRFNEWYPGIRVAGTLCPPLGFENDEKECERLVETVNAAAPEILFIGLGAPKQEKWLWRYRGDLNFGVALCVGAAFDFAAGFVPRAPRVLRVLGFEWLWRLGQEPKRLWQRYILRDMGFIRLAARTLWQSRVSSAGR